MWLRHTKTPSSIVRGRTVQVRLLEIFENSDIVTSKTTGRKICFCRIVIIGKDVKWTSQIFICVKNLQKLLFQVRGFGYCFFSLILSCSPAIFAGQSPTACLFQYTSWQTGTVFQPTSWETYLKRPNHSPKGFISPVPLFSFYKVVGVTGIFWLKCDNYIYKILHNTMQYDFRNVGIVITSINCQERAWHCEYKRWKCSFSDATRKLCDTSVINMQQSVTLRMIPLFQSYCPEKVFLLMRKFASKCCDLNWSIKTGEQISTESAPEKIVRQVRSAMEVRWWPIHLTLFYNESV